MIVEKLGILTDILRDMGTVLIAYSGGVDSSFLTVMAYEVLGSKSLAVLSYSPVSPPGERDEAESLAVRCGFRYRSIEGKEMDNPEFTANPPERCYYCKRELFQELKRIAAAEGLAWIADGTNADDTTDYRPGRRAGAEAGVRSPMLEAGLTKEEIRQLSREKGLPTWNRPASPCLASRIPYGISVTPEILHKIGEGENFLHSLGLQNLRLRHHGDLARIEVNAGEIPFVLTGDIRDEIVKHLQELGYRYVTLDLAGYRTGSLNTGVA